MPVTLAQAQALSQDKLTNYVIDEFRKSALLDRLVFDDNDIMGSGKSLAYVYNRVTTMPTAAPRLINAEFVAQEAATTQITANLRIFGGSFQIDRALAANQKKVMDEVQFQLQQKIQATIAEFNHLFINGNAGLGTGEFDGMEVLLTGGAQEILTGVDLDSGADITSNWRTLLDQMRQCRSLLQAAPTAFLMNQDMFRVFQSVMDRAAGSQLTKTNYGEEVLGWGNSLVMALGDRPGTANPIIATAAGLTSIFAVTLGLDAVHGVAPVGQLARTYLPDMSAPGAVKTGEVEMIACIAMKGTRSAAVIRNIDIA